jgi:hypothetical protein
MIKEVTTYKDQTLTDIALQEYGNAQAVFEIVSLNSGLLNDFGDEEQTVEDVTRLDIAYPLRAGQIVKVDTESSLVNTQRKKELTEIIVSE